MHFYWISSCLKIYKYQSRHFSIFHILLIPIPRFINLMKIEKPEFSAFYIFSPCYFHASAVFSDFWTYFLRISTVGSMKKTEKIRNPAENAMYMMLLQNVETEMQCWRFININDLGCIHFDPSKSKSGWWNFQLDRLQLCTFSYMAWFNPNFVPIKKIANHIT